MNHDDVMWNVMGQGFCSYKVKTRDKQVRFCRNPYNVTGICSRATCPLSNSQYATIVEHEDELYLYVKTAERAHLPRRQWEKVKLDTSFPKALEQLDSELQWWDRRHVNKVKARLLRMKQYLMRKRKMLMEPQPEYVSVNKRQEHKLLRREEKAERAARLELEVERELLDRMRKGTYDSIINYQASVFDKILTEEAQDEEQEEDFDEEEDLGQFEMDDEMDYDEEDDEMEYEQEDERPRAKTQQRRATEFVMDDDDDDDDGDDIESGGGLPGISGLKSVKPSAARGAATAVGRKSRGSGSGSTSAVAGKKRTRVTIEKEFEQEPVAQPGAEEW